MQAGRWASGQVERTHGEAADCADKERLAYQETKESKPLAVNIVGVVKVGENPSLKGEFIGKWC